MQYYAFTFQIAEDWLRELLMAQLNDIGFEGFEEQANEVIAYIPAAVFKQLQFDEAITLLQETRPFTFIKTEIEEQNWNAAWEKNFLPVIINREIAVRASFHPPFGNIPYEIIIDPKMSFGTGHHETTGMMLELILKQQLTGKRVLDFGSGTGILSILASKRNAATVLAIDHEKWAYHNAIENFQLNHVENAIAKLGDAAAFDGLQFDFIFANINRSTIINYMQRFAKALAANGKLLVSGFLKSDEPLIVQAAGSYGLETSGKMVSEDWMALIFQHRM